MTDDDSSRRTLLLRLCVQGDPGCALLLTFRAYRRKKRMRGASWTVRIKSGRR